MEKGPEFRIVGNASEEKKEQAKKELEGFLFNNYESLPDKFAEILKSVESPKTESEISLIDFANKETNKLMEDMGVRQYDVPSENVHILPPELFKIIATKEDGLDGGASVSGQFICLNEKIIRKMGLLGSAVTIFHELMHLKGHTSLELNENDKPEESSVYRNGLFVSSAKKTLLNEEEPHGHFDGLNEAIVSTQEKKSFQKLLEEPFLKKEKKLFLSEPMSKLRGHIKKKFEVTNKMAELAGIDNRIDEDEGNADDIFWVGLNDDGMPDFSGFSYPKHRKVLNYAMEEIQKDFPDQFKSTDDVFKEFLRAYFTGQLLSLARLVEDTFGKGSFRLLGDMGTDEKSASLHLILLMKKRADKLEEKQS